MKSTFKHMIALLFLLHLCESNNDARRKAKTSRPFSKIFEKHPSNGLISFNSEEGKVRIDWAVTIPFVSIPLEHKVGENGEVSPFFDVNTKGLGIVGIIATLLGVVTPLFSKTHSQFNYRSEDNGQWLQTGNTITEIIFGNSYVAPCMQRIACSIVSMATHRENPTSVDKIIDGLSSHTWFKDITNGTIIQDAVITGQKGNRDCSHVYKDCLISSKLLETMMNEFGIV